MKRPIYFRGVKFSVWWILCLVPFVILLFMVRRYGIPVPFYDELFFVPMFEELFLHRAFDSRLIFVQLNEHRPLFPLLLIVILAAFSRWNMWLELFVSPILALGSFGIIASLVSQTLSVVPRILQGLLLLCSSMLIFSLGQWENWTFGITLHFTMANLAFLVALFLLFRFRHSSLAFLCAVLSAFVATFSSAYGLLAWPALLPLVLHDRRKCASWLFLGLLTFVLFYVGNRVPVRNPDTQIAYVLLHPLEVLRYVILFLGSALFAWNRVLAFALGIVEVACMCAAGIFLWKRKFRDSPLTLWFCVALFSLLSALAIAVGRTGLLVNAELPLSAAIDFSVPGEHAMTAKYAVISHLLLVALLCMLALKFRRTRIVAGVFVLVLVAQLSTNVLSIPSWRERHAILSQGAACFRNYEQADTECLGILYFGGGEQVRSYAETLDRIGFLRR